MVKAFDYDELLKRRNIERHRKEKLKILMIFVVIIELSYFPLWRASIDLSVILSFIVQTYVISFFTTFRGYFLFRFIMDILYFADVVLSILYLATYKLISSDYQPKKKVFIVIDILTLFSFDYVIDFGSRSRINPAFIIMQFLLFLRCYRIIFYSVSSSQLGPSAMLSMIVKMGCVTYLTLHTLTCMWVYICGFQSAPWTRGLIAKDIVISSPIDEYRVSAYTVAMFLCGTGYGDLAAITITERIIVMLIMTLGIVWLGIAVAALNAYHTDESQHSFEFSAHLKLINQDLAENPSITATIREKIVNYYRSLWTYKDGVINSSFFDGLPPTIRTAAFTDQYWEALEKSKILCNLDLPSKRALSCKMRSQIYVKGDIIIKQGELRTCMMYIIRGVVKVLSSEDTESSVMILTEGSLIGETALMLSTPSPVQLEAASTCEVQILDRVNLYITAMDYKQIGEEIFNNFIRIWNEAIKREEQFRDERAVSMALGLKKERDTVTNFAENDEKERPYTWLHEDEMTHLLSKPKEDEFTFDVYSSCEETAQTSDAICARTKFPFVFQSGTSLLFLWDFIVSVSALIAAVLFPMQVSAIEHLFSNAIFLIDFIYLVDLFVSLFTTADYYGDTLITIGDILSYRLTHFHAFIVVVFDVLAVLPFELFYRGDSTSLKLLLQLNHVLKIWKVQRFFNKLEIRFIGNLALIRSIACLVWISVLSFWMGCFYYLQACFDKSCRDASWFTNELVKDIETRSAIERHSKELELMMFLGVGFVGTIGIADIRGSTLTEFTYVIVLSICSMYISSYFVGSYIAILNLARKSETAFTELVFVIERFMENNGFLNSIRLRVVRYLQLQWQHSQGYYILNDKHLYFDTPKHLMREMLAALRQEELLSVPLFEEIEDIVINYVASHAESYVLPPEEIVVYSGEPCLEFYLIEDGFCEKYSGISGDLECVIGPKGNFCVMETLFDLPATSEVRTASHVRLLRVSKILFQHALSHSPVMLDMIKSLVDEFHDEKVLSKVMPREKKYYDVRKYEKSTRSSVVFSKEDKEYKEAFTEDWSKCILPFLLTRTFLPNGKFIKRWEAFRIVTILIGGFLYPCYSYIYLDIGFLRYIRYILDLISAIDMYILMHVCYYSEDGVLVSHPKATFKHYLTHNFVIDLIVLFPFDMFSEESEAKGYGLEEIYYKVHWVGHFVYFYKLISFYRLRSIREFTEVAEINSMKKWYEDLLFFTCCMILLNALASVLVIISAEILFTENGSKYKIIYFGTSWVQTKDFDVQFISMVHLYAFYWTVCMTFCVAFGDISAVNSQEMMYCVTIFLIGYVLITYMMVRITSRISGFGKFFSAYQENMKQIIEFLGKKHVAKRLLNEVTRHFDHVWEVTNSLEPHTVFCKFHSSLQEDTVVFLYQATFNKCIIFQSMDYSFYRKLGALVREEYYVERANIFQVNDIITDVFFIHKGVVALTEFVETTSEYLTEGSVLGNLSNSASIRISCKVKALTPVVLLKVDNQKFYSLLKDFDYIVKHLRHVTADNKIFIVPHHSDEEAEELRITAQALENKQTSSNVIATTRKEKCQTNVRRFFKELAEKVPELLVICATASVVIISYHAAFQDHDVVVFSIELILTTIYLVYFLVTFTLAIVKKKEMRKTGSHTEWKIYKTKEFWLDLLCFLPINLLCFLASDSYRYELCSYLNATYLIRVYHIIIYFGTAAKFQRLNKKSIKYNIMEMLIITVTVLHLTACVMYVVDCFKNMCSKDKWAYTAEWNEAPNLICQSAYVCALYWAVEVYSCTGVGDIVPDSVADVVLMSILIVFAKFVVCNLVGTLSTVVAEHMFTEGSYNYEMTILKKYLKSCHLSSPVLKHIEGYAENLWRSQSGKQSPTFFSKIPNYLKSSLINEMFGYHIYHNIVFSGSHPDFLRQLVIHLEYTRYFAGNVIVHVGELNGTMYFVDAGEVEVLLENEGNVEITDFLIAGDCFGLIQGLYKSTPHKRTFRAVSSTVILSLNYDSWKYLLPFFPQTHKELYYRAYLFSFMP